jgi:iron(III) transport system substrate-binding protein
MWEEMMTSLALRLSAILLLLVSSTSFAQSAQGAGTLSDLLQKAKAEGEINYLAGAGTLGGPQGFAALGDAFNKKYGLNLKFTYTPGPSMSRMTARLIQEAKAGKSASVDFFLGRAGHVTPMKQQGLLDPFPWSRYFPYISEKLSHYDGRVVVTQSRFHTVVSYNTKLVAKEDAPKKLDDLLQPKWKGKIAIHAGASGFPDVAMGLGIEEKMLAFHRKLVEHAGGVMRSAEIERIASGEFTLMALTGSDTTSQAKERSLPVDWSILEDFAGMNFSCMVVPKTSAHPNAARLFIAYLLTPEGQALLWKLSKEDLHLLPGSRLYEKVKELQSRGVRIAYDDLKNWDDPGYVKRRNQLEESFSNQVKGQ